MLGMLQFLVLVIVYHLITDNRNNISVHGEGPTYGINGNFGSLEKKFIINFSKANTNFAP